MVLFTVHYRFSQRFPFPARQVYDWSTDFREDDVARMHKKGRREVEKLDDSTLILTDETFENGRKVRKVRLVRLYPEQMMWTNTRLSEEGKHSQFIYQVVPEGRKASRLDFIGAQVDEAPNRRPTSKEIGELSKAYAKADALSWVYLSEALEQDLAGPRGTRGTSGSRAR